MLNLSHRYQRNAAWLIQLRWVAVVGQIVTTVAATWLFGIEIPMLHTVLGLIGLTAISNLLLTVVFRRWASRPDGDTYPWNLVLGLVLVSDLLTLTGLLYATGGPNNPFWLFFFVNLSLCALLLDRNWTLAINALTVMCFAGLLIQHEPLPPMDLGFRPLARGAGMLANDSMLPGAQANRLTLQHLGALVAFSTCSGVIVYFMTRLTGELAKHQVAVRRAEAMQARSEKVEALGTLAAGAAHELATPLSTIAVVAKDVEDAVGQEVAKNPDFSDVVEDVQLIRNQLTRCRIILDRMAGHAGETIGESFKQLTIAQLCDAVVDGSSEAQRVRVSLPEEAQTETVFVPVDGLTQALRCIIQNAIDADPTDRPISVAVEQKLVGGNSFWQWQIRDQGIGMTPAELERVSEPFFTTKPPGKGMGLGVFLAQNVFTRLDAKLEYESQPGQGTCVTVLFPIQAT